MTDSKHDVRVSKHREAITLVCFTCDPDIGVELGAWDEPYGSEAVGLGDLLAIVADHEASIAKTEENR